MSVDDALRTIVRDAVDDAVRPLVDRLAALESAIGERDEHSGNGRLLNVAEAADHLGISQGEVRALARAGELPGRRVGRLWRFAPTDLESFGK